MAKSANKHISVYMQAYPLNEELAHDIDNDLINARQDIKERKKLLVERHDWDSNEALKIWCFGPETSGPNLLVDKTEGIQVG